MMRWQWVMIPAGYLVLAACSGGSDEPKSPDDVLMEAENLVKPVPGLYRSDTELVDFDIPGIPPAQAAQIREMAGGLRGSGNNYCLTEAEAEEGFRNMAKRFSEGEQGISCNFTEFEADGSDLDATLKCTGPGGVDASIAMDGTVEPEKSTMRMQMSQKSPAIPGGEMRMTMEVKSERIGDCG